MNAKSHSHSHATAGGRPDFPLIDYHVHLGPDLSLEQAVKLSEQKKVKFGIVENVGPQSLVKNDEELLKYINRLRQYPVYVGLQPTVLNWSQHYSKEVLDQLDYVLMDADTVPLPDGSYLRIWQNDLFIDDMDEFMEIYMHHITQILAHEPIDIFGRPTYLPINFAREYDRLWTNERLSVIIDLARERHIALEIQENVRIPSDRFIAMAKKAGVKFTFGTNARNHNAGHFHYCLEMAAKHGLTRDDMFIID
ncbi:MAG TPA: hypothetical protein GXX29_09785 [Firmicutes bacterium]|nr:hypothetical protein [Bacillota bacterium]